MKLTTTLAITVLAVSAAASHAATLLDFENANSDFGLVEGDAINSQYQPSFGVTFSGDSPQLIQVGAPVFGFKPNDTPDPDDAFGEYFLGTAFDNGMTGLRIDYDSPVQGLSFDMADIDGGEQFTIQAFDSMDMLVDSMIIMDGDPGTGNRKVVKVALMGLDISYVTIVGITPGNMDRRLGIAFDNFRVDTAQVPVPAALPLLAGGLGMFGALRVRRNRKN